MEIVRLKDIKKIYKSKNEEVEALKSISLTINEGEMVAVMGPSGSGKSTLLHIIGLIDTPTEGSIEIDNKDVSKLNLSKFRNEYIGFVFQLSYLLPEFTALENVMMPLLISKKEKPKEKAINILKKLGLEHRVNHKPSQLSGGEQQRVAIARAIVNNPKILVADEPTGNLDSENTKIVMEIFKNLNKEKNTTIIIATHDIEVAKNCDRIIYIKDGKILKEEKAFERV
ncbi:ABC transporter ATP-binding protein [Venenivibrio stagnispumantis]|uniref:Lipoprotein-releasing system ATP-binding protein n=1 Tax=Venenivibrio stagnispumantis TaxID=407998 RepID=A0AA45WI26_9AQUI|nr:ABC transporter ATP-binding protein [Venenivibrio stagnispumantis]MCW4572728.1 ABC transporter ATP-binding protein [Venenivibrio stagnispumantis]SMP00206.1 lipoprotein-releasing system ATP-binding protein [Venenivibrio stagnispumantis]